MKAYQQLPDPELVTLLKDGDFKAFTEIYTRYRGLLLKHAYAMLRDDEESMDVVQDTFQLLWEKGTKLEMNKSLGAFLYTTVRFKVLNHYKHAKVEKDYFALLAKEMDSAVSTTDEAIEEKELAKRIEAGLNKLPPKMRAVFELSRVHEYSYKEISEELGLADNTVKRQISNALKIMRESVKKGFLYFY